MVEEHLTLVDFADYQINAFLEPWRPFMPPERSVENLLENLRDRPRIMQLARNPLQAMTRRWWCRGLYRATRGKRRCPECSHS